MGWSEYITLSKDEMRDHLGKLLAIDQNQKGTLDKAEICKFRFAMLGLQFRLSGFSANPKEKAEPAEPCAETQSAVSRVNWHSVAIAFAPGSRAYRS